MTSKFSVLMFVAGLSLAVGLGVVRAQGSAQGSSQGTAQGSAQGTAQGSAQGTGQGSVQGTAQGSAQGSKPVTALTSPVTGNAVAGRKLYYDHACYSCHGFNGETGARAFVPNWPANLATERSFIAFLRGRANVAPVQPSTAMPNYPVESVSDAQAKDIYAYIRTFKSAQPPVEKIPVMNQILAAAKKPYKQ
jgi:mono/diheme cytochrome c family protein